MDEKIALILPALQGQPTQITAIVTASELGIIDLDDRLEFSVDPMSHLVVFHTDVAKAPAPTPPSNGNCNCFFC